MILKFETDTVEIEENDVDVLVVGFYTEENYFMIQQSLDEYDEQDARLGMDTYHIERDDQSFGGYGGVGQIKLQRNLLEVELDEKGKTNLECSGINIAFQTPEDNFRLLRKKLKFIFGDVLVLE